ncbi:hypothetical protein [Thiobacillus sp.]
MNIRESKQLNPANASSAGSARSRSKALQDQHCYQTWNVLFSLIEMSSIAFFQPTTGAFTGVARPLAMISAPSQRPWFSTEHANYRTKMTQM